MASKVKYRRNEVPLYHTNTAILSFSLERPIPLGRQTGGLPTAGSHKPEQTHAYWVPRACVPSPDALS